MNTAALTVATCRPSVGPADVVLVENPDPVLARFGGETHPSLPAATVGPPPLVERAKSPLPLPEDLDLGGGGLAVAAHLAHQSTLATEAAP